jgi:AcrR family transcriptional regulator
VSARSTKNAFELFAARGFEQTTAAEIAQSVGLTERTFFRHFSDKREVLFYGQQQFLQAFTDGVEAAPPDASPLQVIACALQAAAFFPDERRLYSRLRQSVIDQNPPLQEREQHKLAGLATTVAGAQRAGHRRAGRHARGAVRRHRFRDRVRAVDPRRRNALPRRDRLGRPPRTAQFDRSGSRGTAAPITRKSPPLASVHVPFPGIGRVGGPDRIGPPPGLHRLTSGNNFQATLALKN